MLFTQSAEQRAYERMMTAVFSFLLALPAVALCSAATCSTVQSLRSALSIGTCSFRLLSIIYWVMLLAYAGWRVIVHLLEKIESYGGVPACFQHLVYQMLVAVTNELVDGAHS